MRTRALAVVWALAALAGGSIAVAGGGDLLLVVDSGNDRVMLFSAADGALIDANYISDADAVGWQFTTPKEAIVVNDEIWVTDQVEDDVHRFDKESLAFIGSISLGPGDVPMDNLRGLGFDGSKVYVANFGGGLGPSIVTFTTAGVADSVFTTGGSPFDAEPWMDELLVSNSSGGVVQRYMPGGGFIANFASGFSTPQQVIRLADDSVIIGGSLGVAGVRGVYHFESDGTQRTFISVESIGQPPTRSGWLLENGNYLVTTDDGVFLAIPAALDSGPPVWTLSLVFADATAQYIGLLPGAAPCPFDLDGDGSVGSGDIALLLGSWGQMGVPADFDGGGVGASDLALLLGAWGPCP